MLKTILIGFGVLLLFLFICIMYCALVVASREDDWMEQMHIQWMMDHPEMQGDSKEPKSTEHQDEKTDSSDAEVTLP